VFHVEHRETTMTDETKLPVLPDIRERYDGDKLLRCSCGSHVFFDWGLQIMVAEDFPNPREKDWQYTRGVCICASCLKPVVFDHGKAYDASRIVSDDEISKLIQWANEKRTAAVPIKAMDP
jgi:hypothetical protein